MRRAGSRRPPRGGTAERAGKRPWRGLDDYQENGGGDFLANAIASGAPHCGALRDALGRARTPRRRPVVRARLSRCLGGASVPPPGALPAHTSHAAAARRDQRPLRHPPSEDWDGGIDPWTAPTAWTAWGLAALGERRAALHLMTELRRAATPAGMLPERVDAHTGTPTSTTPLAWSHAFAILALRQLWPS